MYGEPIYKLVYYYTLYSGSGAWFSNFRAKKLIGQQLYIHWMPRCGTLYSIWCYMYNILRAINMRIYGVFTVLWDHQSPLVPAVQHTNMGIYG